MKRALFASAGFLFSATCLFAQPPGITRWSGNTANGQPQGFTQGSPLTLTWGFMAPNTPINDGFGGGDAPNNLQTFLNGIYGGGQAEWQPHFQSVFNRWSSISGLSYVFEPNDDGAIMTNLTTSPAGVLNVRPDIRIGGKAIDGNFNTLAYNYGPNHGDMVIDTTDSAFTDTSSGSLLLRNTVAHEHGHGVGMAHVDSLNASFLMEPFLTLGFNGPQYHDILVAQRGYGDANEKSFAGQGNDAFTRATALGAIAPGGSTSVGNSARTLVVASTAVDFVSIDSATDTDFFSFSVTSAGQVSILLEALGFTYFATVEGGGGNQNFNTLQRSNLALALLGPDGTTVLASSDITSFGGNESVLFDLPAAGTYFVRVTGADNFDASSLDTQFFGLTINVAAVPEPLTLALLGGIGLGGAGVWWHRRRQTQSQLEQDIVDPAS